MSGFGEMVSTRFRPAASALSAISRGVSAMLTNDWTEAALPNTKIDLRSQPGPKRTLLRQ